MKENKDGRMIVRDLYMYVCMYVCMCVCLIGTADDINPTIVYTYNF